MDYVHRSAGECAKLWPLLVQTFLSHVRMCGSSVTGALLRAPQPTLGIINIPAVENLACVAKRDKTAFAHLTSQHRLPFIWRRQRFHQGDEKQPRITTDASFIFSPARLSLTHTVIFMFYSSCNMFCCCRLNHSAAAIPPYPHMLFAPRANISNFCTLACHNRYISSNYPSDIFTGT